jgi:hypothetical protein
MDIHTWLENTADRAPPDTADDRPSDAPRPDIPRPPSDLARQFRHKRKRASDSSLIDPGINRRHAVPPLPRTATPAYHAVRTDPDRSGTCTSSSSGEARAPARTYERRPRHKTRTDRYERKGKKAQQGAEPTRRGKKPKRRKSDRTHDGSRTAGLVQSFQLKNGPKNSRLTVCLHACPICLTIR